ERIHEAVLIVARVESRLAADGRDADAVAIAADAVHDAAYELFRPRRVPAPEAERVEQRNGTRAHREHVAEDSAHAGRCALVRLDLARVVVRLHFEHGREPVPDVDRARVLAGTD